MLKKLSLPPIISDVSKEIEIKKVIELQHPGLLEYLLKEWRINLDLSKLYLKEVHFD